MVSSALPSSTATSSIPTIAGTLAGVGAAAVLAHHLLSKQRKQRSELRKSLNGTTSSPGSEDDISSLILSSEKQKKNDDDDDCIYLDYNGTTPVHPLVLAAMIPFLSIHFGNPSSGHYYGKVPREAISKSRRSVLQLLHQPSSSSGAAMLLDEEDSLIFTGCGTESNNLAIYLALNSALEMEKGTKKHIVTSNVEHPAVTECLKALELRGEIEVTYVPVSTEGIVSSSDVISALRPNKSTVLVTLMVANNESGAIQPIGPIARACRERNILFHTDAAQAVGKINLDIEETLGGADMVTLVGHKFGAPKGVAALYVRPGCLTEAGKRKEPELYGSAGGLLLGGGQERGRRAGTENVPYIVGMGRAAELLSTNDQWKINAVHMEKMRNRLLENLTKHLGKDMVRPNGPSDATKRLPNTLSVGLCNIQSGELLKNIGNEVAASAGSACHASGGGISSVLKAMKVPEEYAAGTLRLSVGPRTTEEDVDRAAECIVREAKRQREMVNLKDT